MPRLLTPLIEPDGPFEGIRLSDKARSLNMKPRPLAVDPKSFERSGGLPPRIAPALDSETSAEAKPWPSVAEEPESG